MEIEKHQRFLVRTKTIHTTQFHLFNLQPCTLIGQALVNDIHTIQPSVNGINEVGVYLKKEAEPPFAIYIQKLLDELNGQWENVCKQVSNLHSETVCSSSHASL